MRVMDHGGWADCDGTNAWWDCFPLILSRFLMIVSGRQVGLRVRCQTDPVRALSIRRNQKKKRPNRFGNLSRLILLLIPQHRNGLMFKTRRVHQNLEPRHHYQDLEPRRQILWSITTAPLEHHPLAYIIYHVWVHRNRRMATAHVHNHQHPLLTISPIHNVHLRIPIVRKLAHHHHHLHHTAIPIR
jgi:hypothetical protein